MIMLSFIFEILRNLINFRKKSIDVSKVFAQANWCLHDDRGMIVSNNVASVVVAGLIILVGLAVKV